MSDLTTACISDLAITYSGSTPSRQCAHFFGGEIPWVKSSEVDCSAIKTTEETLTQIGLISSSAKWIDPEVPLVAMYGATAGKVGWLKIKAVTNQAVLAVIPREKQKTSAKYLYWTLLHSSQRLLIKQQGSGQPNLSKKLIDNHKITVLPYPEQNYIADILDTLDTTIRRTEAIIAKLQQVKQGLLHDLLTRGIDANGQLRPPVEQAPHLYKESPLGWIPKEWDLSNLGEKTDWFSGGTPSKAHRLWWSGDIPFLTPKDMKRFEIEETIENITMEAANFGSKLMSAETVFIVVRGMILAHTFPVCISSCPLAFNQDIKAISGRGDISSRFLAHWFVANSSMFLRKVTEATHGTKKLDLQVLHTTLIGIPSPEEQTRIVRRTESIDHAISVELARYNQTKSLKSALMDDLLTGRVRVTVLLAQVDASS